jgi:drug/metabolite transporter (DMT)-like permease
LDDHRAMTRVGVLRCAAAAVLFGATVPVASRVAGEMSAPVLAGLLYVGAALAAGPLARNRPLARGALARSARPLAVAVVAGGFLGPLLLAAGLARTTAATASLLLNFELVATAVLAALFFGEHLGRRVVTGTLLVTAAGVALGWAGTPEVRLGSVLVLFACLCWALDNCVTAKLDQIAPEHITLAKGVVAGSANLALGFALGGDLPSAAHTGLALAAGAFGYGLSITLWVAGARDLGAARGQLVFSTAPFIGVLLAWIALGDPVRGVEIVALVLAGLGVLLVLGSTHDHPHLHQRVDHDHDHTHDQHHQHHQHHPSARRHSHRHVHEPFVHAHPHVPDLHHRHPHPGPVEDR